MKMISLIYTTKVTNIFFISYAWKWIKACGLMCFFAMADQWGSKIIVA